MKELKSSSPVAHQIMPNLIMLHLQPQKFLGGEGDILPRICGMQRGGRSAGGANSQDHIARVL